MLDSNLVYAKIQLGVVEYKAGDIASAMATFDEAEIQFPKKAEVINYKGELFMDQGDVENASLCFDKSIEIDPTSSLPYINKGTIK